ncbi:hypothetical protein H5410_031134 [Solanum commersonii]|uniref:Uncharacterized protein n=1 Tax=Solanum commersonii TaxID=4109 RepID=A0A9J5YKS8_SOLCO|nr:hypothetical protein H5410_031134 [Solanum commersonii]
MWRYLTSIVIFLNLDIPDKKTYITIKKFSNIWIYRLSKNSKVKIFSKLKNESLQYYFVLELKAIIVREIGKKPLFCCENVCALDAGDNQMLAKQNWRKGHIMQRKKLKKVSHRPKGAQD